MKALARIAQASQPLIGVAAGALALRLAGWPNPPELHGTLLKLSGSLLVLFPLAEILHVLLGTGFRNFIAKRKTRSVLALSLFILGLLCLLPRESALSPNTPWTVVALLVVSAASATKILSLTGRRWFTHLHPGIIGVGAFAIAIVLGALLLKSPNATPSRVSIDWDDAFFQSASAVCVTGLITVDTQSELSLFGQTVILVLIQAGGLGIMTWAYLMAAAWGEGNSLRDRVIMKDLLTQNAITNLKSRIAAILAIMLIVETIGFALLYVQFSGIESENHNRAFTACFHAISAYCNAGFSTFSGNLMDPGIPHPESVATTIAVLVVMGGLGTPVWIDLWFKSKIWIRNLTRPTDRTPGRFFLSLHTRISLSATAFLLVAGAISLYLAGAASRHGSPIDWGIACFDSVTARTAGFNISPISEYSHGSLIFLMILMFIGACPGGTAGGIKCTTFAVVMINLKQTLLDARDANVAGRRLPPKIISQSLALITMASLWIVGASLALQWLEPDMAFLDIAFESVSAFGTVGLSRGITPDLGSASKWIIILTMFVGRLGILLVFCSFLPPRPDSRLNYPQEAPLIT